VHVLPFGSEGLTLHLRATNQAPLMRDHCTAPCRLDLEPGRYELSVQPRGGGPRRADDQPVWISGDDVAIQASYDHRSGLRVLGWVFFSTGVSAFGLSLIGGIFTGLIIGLPIAAAFLIPFVPLAFLEDSARVQVVPLNRQ